MTLTHIAYMPMLTEMQIPLQFDPPKLSSGNYLTIIPLLYGALQLAVHLSRIE